jgi:hypothetical protein
MVFANTFSNYYASKTLKIYEKSVVLRRFFEKNNFKILNAYSTFFGFFTF